jgi:hypothetical protein
VGSATLKAGAWSVNLKRPKFETSRKRLRDALQETLDMAALREDRLGEILTQVGVPYSYFAMLLNLQPGRHRYTYELMSAALILSGLAVMQFKHHFAVRRPADHSPLIQPVLLTPSHGSYPAGHASQSNILAEVLHELVRNKLGKNLKDQLDKLADRIGENRVVAGVHYVEDISEGGKLGRKLAKYFLGLAKAPGPKKTPLRWLWKKAVAEWT